MSEEKNTSPDEQKPVTPAPEEQKAPAEQPSTPVPGQKPEEKAGDKPAETKAPTEKGGKGKRNVWGVLADILLVLVLLGVVGMGCLYLYNQKAKYHIPTPMEQAMLENNELTAEIIALTQQYKDAERLLALNEEYKAIQGKINDKRNELTAENNACTEKVAKIEITNRRILALQHQIRSLDDSNRQIAYNALTGMNIGDITTTTGKAYRNATITFLDKKFIGVRTPTGAARFPVKQLVKENLPDIALYAFGKLDLVDMTDFDTEDNDGAATRKGKARQKGTAKQKRRKPVSYEPKPSGPVVDTRTDDPAILPAPADEPGPEETDDGLAPE